MFSIDAQEAARRVEADHAITPEGWFHTALAVFAGALGIVLSFAPWNMFPLAFVALIPILAVTRGTTDAVTFRRAWLFGLLMNLGGFPWIVQLVVNFGEMPVFVGFGLWLLMCAQQGIVPALAFWAARKVERNLGWRHGYALVPAYVVAEFLVPLIFPWRLGHSQVYHLNFLQLAELGGVHLMTLVVVLVNVGLYDVIRRVRARELLGIKDVPRITVVAAALFLATQVYGVIRVKAVERAQEDLPRIRIGLVEGDIEIEDKWNAELLDYNLLTHQHLSAQAVKEGAELVMWPESAYELGEYHLQLEAGGRVERTYEIPRDAYRFPPSDSPLPKSPWEDARAKVPEAARFAPQRGFRVPLLTGTMVYRNTTAEEKATLPPSRRGPRRVLFYNSAMLLDDDGVVQALSDKVVLMPLSETMPGGEWLYSATGINLYRIVPVVGLFGSGDGPSVITHVQKKADGTTQDVRMGMLNCYEDLMPGFVRDMQPLGMDMLVNLTNDAWFGRYIAPTQHLALALPRAVESRTWMIRATNTGVSIFVDASGRVRGRTNVTEPEVLVRDVPLKQAVRTPYVAFGEWASYASLLVMAGGLWRGRRRVKPAA